jgi:hypothetical protein
MNANFLETLSSLIAIAGALLLWASYVILGLIASRYQRVFHQNTMGQLLMVAPTGILIYSCFLILKTTPLVDDPGLLAVCQWIAYLSLCASGVLCAWGTLRFSRVYKSIMSGMRQEARLGGRP